MEKILYAAMCAVLFFCCSSSDEPEANSQSSFMLPDKAIGLAEQSSKSVVILDASTYRTVWSWNPGKAGVPSNCQTWFHNPSEVRADQSLRISMHFHLDICMIKNGIKKK